MMIGFVEEGSSEGFSRQTHESLRPPGELPVRQGLLKLFLASGRTDWHWRRMYIYCLGVMLWLPPAFVAAWLLRGGSTVDDWGR